MTAPAVLALDLGATSGRLVRATVGPDVLDLETVARFENRPVPQAGRLHWDVLRLWSDAMDGIRSATRDRDVLSIGVDAWGVDYGLLRRGALIGNPRHYRDSRGRRGMEVIHQGIPPRDLYHRNGTQQLPINTIYQLATERDDGFLDVADRLLMIPDLFAYWLSGVVAAERTIASTTGLLDPRQGQWDQDLCRAAGLDAGLLAPLVDAGARIGANRDEIAREVGRFEVIAVGAHDTASAVVAIPMDPDHAVFISCGTWGLVGVELRSPVVDARSFHSKFTNELGVDGKCTVLRNVMGLWLLSESIRWWELEGVHVPLGEIIEAAAARPPSPHLFDVDDADFAEPGDIPDRIGRWFRERQLPEPGDAVAVVRCILDSLAQAFADAAVMAASIGGVDARVVHMVGGGSLNALLCQEIANRTGLPVLAGPVEATAIGNVLLQARTAGIVAGGLDELRQVVRDTQRVVRFAPE